MSGETVNDRYRHRFCQICQQALAVHVHHRKMRSQSGGQHPDNLMDVCLTCHDYIHANPAESYRAGWLINSWDEVKPYKPMQLDINYEEIPWDQAGKHEHPGGDEDECPRCHGKGRVKKPKPKEELNEPKPKAIYSIRVPMTERENGYETLKTLFDEVVKMDVKDGWLQSEKGADYYVAIRALYMYLTRPQGE